MLSYTEFGDSPASSDRPALIIVHGLYGSGRNWGVIAKRLSDSRRVITLDMAPARVCPAKATLTWRRIWPI
jgi:esterase